MSDKALPEKIRDFLLIVANNGADQTFLEVNAQKLVGELDEIFSAESQRTPRELADRYNENVGQIIERTQAPSELLVEIVKKCEFQISMLRGAMNSPNSFDLDTVDANARAMQDELQALWKNLKAGTQAQAAQWIRCDERLPEPDVAILCYGQGLQWITLLRGRFGKPWWEHNMESCPFEMFTHWQPLPVAPVAALEGKHDK